MSRKTNSPHRHIPFDTVELYLVAYANRRPKLDDVTLPPVVVHVEVPPVADARYDEFAQASFGRQTGYSFKLIRGLRGQFLAAYGEHTIEIWTNDRQHLLATQVVDVRPSDTESRVVVTIPHR